MASNDLPTPDSIKSQNFRVGSNLEPAAKAISAYQGATRADVPEVPQTNGIQQLSAALSHIQPTLNQGVAYVKTIEDQKAEAAAIVASEKAQAANVNDLKEAQAKGLIPDGAAPNFVRAFNTNMLKLRSESGVQKMRDAFYSDENAHIRNSDDPEAIRQFATKFRQDHDKGVLYNQDGAPLHTDLERVKSGYDDTFNQGVNALYKEHSKDRITEREKLAGDNASNLMATRISKASAPGVERNYKQMAQDVLDVFYNPTTGYVAYGGLSKSVASKSMVDGIVTSAVSAGDVELLKIADHVDTGNGGYLAGTQYARTKIQEAREHIARQSYADTQHREELAKLEVAGTFEERKVQYKDTFDKTKSDQAKAHYTDTMTNKILQYDPKNMTAEDVTKQQIDLHDLRMVDAKAATQLEEHLLKSQEHRDTKTAGRRSDLTEMELLNEIGKNPGPRANKLIDQALKDERIDGEAFRRLRAESDQQGQANLKFAGVLKDPMVTNIFTGVAKAAVKDETQLFGEGSLASAQAEHDMRKQAVEFMEKNPKASSSMLADYLVPRMAPTVDRYNTLTRQAHEEQVAAAKDRQRVIDETNAMQDRVTKEVQQLRTGAPAPKTKKSVAEMRAELEKRK
jgi:hypothetical protein